MNFTDFSIITDSISLLFASFIFQLSFEIIKPFRFLTSDIVKIGKDQVLYKY